MSAEEKINYYTEKLSGNITKEDVKEFLDDMDECVYNGEMYCMLCSAACFKNSVLKQLSKDTFLRLFDIAFDIKYSNRVSEV